MRSTPNHHPTTPGIETALLYITYVDVFSALQLLAIVLSIAASAYNLWAVWKDRQDTPKK